MIKLVGILLTAILISGCEIKTERQGFNIHSKADLPLRCDYQKNLTREDSVFFSTLALSAYDEKCLNEYGEEIQYRFIYDRSFADPYIVKINPEEISIKIIDGNYLGTHRGLNNLSSEERAELYASWFINHYRNASQGKSDSINYFKAKYPKISDPDYINYLNRKKWVWNNDTLFYKTITFKISAEAFDSIKRKMSTSNFWNTKSYNYEEVMDGSSFTLEAKEKNRYHYVYYKMIDKNPAFKDLCMEFLKYTDLKPDKIY